MARTSSHEFGFSKSLEGVSNGIASMLPRLLDTDDEYDYGPKPSELYGTYTWKISKFSEINKSESRSNVFNVGGYKWCILLYHKGFNDSNRISLFLCVANSGKLPPGWVHFAHFTMVVENKDPKKSENKNALHRFWQKEHSWGWKNFIILPTLLDGFVEDDTLTIKVRVQVIREIKDRPFRCLDSQYKSELIRLYRSNVENICCDFVEDKKERIEMFIEDEVRWSRYWSRIDQKSRDNLSRENFNSILPKLVKHLFIEKKDSSTLVMESLYRGLKALREPSNPIVRIEEDTFILVDDVALLLKREATKPFLPKVVNDPLKGSKTESVESDERWLTELGRRTIEIVVLAHLVSKIEAAHHDDILKRQVEFIRKAKVSKFREHKKEKTLCHNNFMTEKLANTK